MELSYATRVVIVLICIAVLLIGYTLIPEKGDCCQFFGGSASEQVIGTVYVKTSVLAMSSSGSNHIVDSDGIDYGYIGSSDVNPYLQYSGKQVTFLYVKQTACPLKASGRYIIFVEEKNP